MLGWDVSKFERIKGKVLNEIIDMNTEEKNIYELGYHLIGTLSEEDAQKEADELREAVLAMGAEMIAEDSPKLRPLAYAITKKREGKNTKYTSAYFGWIKFELAISAASSVKKIFYDNQKVLRFLLSKTVRESTLMQQRPVRRPDSPEVRRKEESSGPVNPEEIDKKIDALVAE